MKSGLFHPGPPPVSNAFLVFWTEGQRRKQAGPCSTFTPRQYRPEGAALAATNVASEKFACESFRRIEDVACADACIPSHHPPLGPTTHTPQVHAYLKPLTYEAPVLRWVVWWVVGRLVVRVFRF